jgi:hypothetical protein
MRGFISFCYPQRDFYPQAKARTLYDQPAECCGVDRTIPYPMGLTHPSNLKCLCRKHAVLVTVYPPKQRHDTSPPE